LGLISEPKAVPSKALEAAFLFELVKWRSMDKEFDQKILRWLPWLPSLLKRFAREAKHINVRRPAKLLARMNSIGEKFPFNIPVDEGNVDVP
jgi:hypothetical protein